MELLIERNNGKQNTLLWQQNLSQSEQNRKLLSKLCDDYYHGSPYNNPGIWRRTLGYKSDLPTPLLYVNIPRMLIERIVQHGFSRLSGALCTNNSSANEILQSIFPRIQPQISEWATQTMVTGDLLLFTRKLNSGLQMRTISADSFTVINDDSDPNTTGFMLEYISTGKGQTQFLNIEQHFIDRIIEFEPIPYHTMHVVERVLKVKEIRDRTSLEPFPTHLRNRPSSSSHYGSSEFADLLRLVDDFNFKLSQRSRNISRTMNALIKSINGRIINTEIGDGEVVHVVGDNAEFDYLINDADMKPIEDHLNTLKWAIRETTGVTVFGLDDMKDIGQLSGFALRQLNRPMFALVASKRATIGSAIERFISSLLISMTNDQKSFEDLNVQLNYDTDMELSESELGMQTDRVIKLLDKGVITQEEARNLLLMPVSTE